MYTTRKLVTPILLLTCNKLKFPMPLNTLVFYLFCSKNIHNERFILKLADRAPRSKSDGNQNNSYDKSDGIEFIEMELKTLNQ